MPLYVFVMVDGLTDVRRYSPNTCLLGRGRWARRTGDERGVAAWFRGAGGVCRSSVVPVPLFGLLFLFSVLPVSVLGFVLSCTVRRLLLYTIPCHFPLSSRIGRLSTIRRVVSEPTRTIHIKA